MTESITRKLIEVVDELTRNMLRNIIDLTDFEKVCHEICNLENRESLWKELDDLNRKLYLSVEEHEGSVSGHYISEFDDDHIQELRKQLGLGE